MPRSVTRLVAKQITSAFAIVKLQVQCPLTLLSIDWDKALRCEGICAEEQVGSNSNILTCIIFIRTEMPFGTTLVDLVGSSEKVNRRLMF